MVMNIIKFIILITIPFTLNAQSLSVDVWLSKYKRSCKEVAVNMVCKGRLDKSLKKMKESVVPGMLKENGIPLWISTVGIVESDYNNHAVSRSDAVGVFQVLAVNIQKFYTKKHKIMIPLRTVSGIRMIETIIERRPTIEESKKLGKDPRINLEVAIWIIKQLHRKYKGDWNLILMSYNAGIVRIDAYLKGEGEPLKFETLNYVNQLMAIQKYIEELE